jgi:PBP1b-binding outer membrane lipoprotein LpoB
VLRSTKMLRRLLLGTLLAALLAGCSQYLDRREGVSRNAGNALAVNQVTQEVDPWPRDSANRNIGFNGQRMQSAVARYRAGKVIEPVGMDTSGSYGQSSASQAGSSANNTTPLGPTVNSQPQVQ